MSVFVARKHYSPPRYMSHLSPFCDPSSHVVVDNMYCTNHVDFSGGASQLIT